MQTPVCICDYRLVANDERPSITITLSLAQVDEVLRAASRARAPSVSTLIANSLSAAPRSDAESRGQRPDEAAQAPMPVERGLTGNVDPRLSRSLLRGLSLLRCFGPNGGARGIVELAGELGMSPSTAHRYAVTLVELGLLERCPNSRKYRLPGL
ncbi:MAG: helix-turn-helix domain-containing protein [Solirubrobacterales bacterium]